MFLWYACNNVTVGSILAFVCKNVKHIAGILGMEVHMIYEKGQTRGDDPGGDTGYSSKCIVQKLWTNQNKKSPIKKYIYLNGES